MTNEISNKQPKALAKAFKSNFKNLIYDGQKTM